MNYKGQRAVKKLATVILEGIYDKKNVVVAWGNGSFGPTSRGHASAPNKALRKSLAPFVRIVLVDEYNTSKKACCCKGNVVPLKSGSYKKRATVVQCSECSCILSRDMNAAVNIINVFTYQTHHHTTNTPLIYEGTHLGTPLTMRRPKKILRLLHDYSRFQYIEIVFKTVIKIFRLFL